jgi:hypothetical protein
MYNLATKYRLSGDKVKIIDMAPELAMNTRVSSINGDMKYDNDLLISDTGVWKECGNFQSEKLVKPIIRSGLPKSVLANELASENFDKIIICDMGSKSDVSSSSSYYSELGIVEVSEIIHNSGFKGEVMISGKYSKIFKIPGGFNKFYDDGCELLDTDLSLIPYRPRRIGVTTSLGCKNNCFFCFVRTLEGDKVVLKDTDGVIKFIDYVVASGYKKLRFMDSDLLSHWGGHLSDIFDKIISKDYGLSVSSYGGLEPSSVTDEIMSKCAKIGFGEMILPLDNCDDSELSFWGGKKSVGAWNNAITIAKKYFKNITSYIMIGYPGQTKENAIESISRCLDLGVNPALLPFTPLDGTGYEDKTISPDKKHPLLFPYAWDKFTVFDMEYLLEKYNTWYKKNTVKLADDIKVYKTTGKPILINGEK